MSSSRRARSRRNRRVLGNIIVVLLGIIALVLLVGLFLPRTYRVARHIEIRADREVIFEDLARVRNWPEWTVWNAGKDPTIQFSFGDIEYGAGAAYRWHGQEVGEGQLTLTSADPATGVEYEVEFRGGRWRSSGSLTFSETDGMTRVDWVDQGELGKNPVNRYFALFMESMMGPDFERGLTNLKSRAEAREGDGSNNPG